MEEFEMQSNSEQEKTVDALNSSPAPQKEEKMTSITLKTQTLFALMGMGALLLFVISKICMYFGVFSTVLYGIMSVLIFGLTLVGMTWGYLRAKKPTFEVLLNLGVFLMTVVFFV